MNTLKLAACGAAAMCIDTAFDLWGAPAAVAAGLAFIILTVLYTMKGLRHVTRAKGR